MMLMIVVVMLMTMKVAEVMTIVTVTIFMFNGHLNVGLHHHLVRLENVCRAKSKDHHCSRFCGPGKKLIMAKLVKRSIRIMIEMLF